MQQSFTATVARVLLLGPKSGSLALPPRCSWHIQQTATGTDLLQLARPSAVASLLCKIQLSTEAHALLDVESHSDSLCGSIALWAHAHALVACRTQPPWKHIRCT